MNNKFIIPISIGIAIIIAGIIIIYVQENEISKSNNEVSLENPLIEEGHFIPAERDWQTSGPFQIDRSQYLLGEKIFLITGDLEENEKGQVAFLKQTNETHYTVFQTIPFDGTKKPMFNYYTDIKLSKVLGLCSVDDVLGEWTVVFRGTNYPNLKFTIINETIPGEGHAFETPVC
ncbi:hypothetical protein C5F47_08125 [Nitrosopumilus cobalaminigenes]|uniref:Uncharacterized protein n=1 Tax=Nitrosopumilus cobalaminigenes TaxID=1470066 RepID=A0A7D5R791_9ARCH|nr:hypothetical protein [Nitrosopumilus cobalaminigenes]QLH03864.1 hypothetical protein C5F47_08125 [Nitrosopumilus cobalaminigenes]